MTCGLILSIIPKACSVHSGPVHKGVNHVPNAVSDCDFSALSWFESLILPIVNAKLFQIRLLKHEKRGVLDRDPLGKPDSEDLWTQSSFGTWFVRVHLEMRAEATHGSISAVGTKLTRSAQILFMIGTVVAMLVNAHIWITNPIRKGFVIQNGFQNSFVNRPCMSVVHQESTGFITSFYRGLSHHKNTCDHVCKTCSTIMFCFFLWTVQMLKRSSALTIHRQKCVSQNSCCSSIVACQSNT